ncbi:flagellin [Natronocalculus amylovorans]|uniref:Flagellin n=1 Tax=Natronocalculus amylovorans TaxID=2917812 RepID=A0AAE3FVJ0_9EURY|nr:flagellin [Natronocalculus amylovorans]MCL9816001.1 flagellin [Natronocalculus amylovorans]
MGFSVSASTAIIVVGLFLAFGMFYPAMANSVDRVTDAQDDQADRMLSIQNTAIELENATKEDIGDEDEEWEVTVNVTNTGSTSIPLSRTDLLINNSYQDEPETMIQETEDTETDLWLPGETAEFTTTVDQEPDRVSVVVTQGIRVSGELETVEEEEQ